MPYLYEIKNFITDEKYYTFISAVFLFAIVSLITVSRKCFWKLICKASNRTEDDAFKKKKEIIAKRTGSVSRAGNSEYISYLQKLAPNQNAVLVLYKIYGLSILLYFFSVSVFVLSLFNSVYKRFIPYTFLSVFIISLAMLTGAKIGYNHKFKYVEKNDSKSPFYYSSLLLRLVFTVIFSVFGVWTMISGVNIYNNQVSQNDWKETAALIYYEKYQADEYIYYYRYEADNQTHFNKTERKGDVYNAGDFLSVKYNPKDPTQSTDILKPQISALIVNELAGILIIGMSLIVAFSNKIYEYRVNKEKMKNK